MRWTIILWDDTEPQYCGPWVIRSPKEKNKNKNERLGQATLITIFEFFFLSFYKVKRFKSCKKKKREEEVLK